MNTVMDDIETIFDYESNGKVDSTKTDCVMEEKMYYICEMLRIAK